MKLTLRKPKLPKIKLPKIPTREVRIKVPIIPYRIRIERKAQ